MSVPESPVSRPGFHWPAVDERAAALRGLRLLTVAAAVTALVFSLLLAGTGSTPAPMWTPATTPSASPLRMASGSLAVNALAADDLAAQLPGPGCDEWNTEVFFEAATVENVTACLEAGANVAARDEDKITPLHWASDPAVVEALLAGGADPMAQDQDGQTPLDLAGENDALRSSDIYWRMNDARYNAP